jgi:hypothetical protein
VKLKRVVWDGRTLTETRKGEYVQRFRYAAGMDGWMCGDGKRGMDTKDSWMQHRDNPINNSEQPKLEPRPPPHCRISSR